MNLVRRLVLLLVATTSAVAAPVPKELRGKKGDHFPTALGSRWEYVVEGTNALDHTREVIVEKLEKDGSRYVEFQWTSHAGKYGELTSCQVDKSGVARLGFGKGHRFAVPYLMLKADTKPGETWDAGIARAGPNGRPAYTGKRGDTETITTPAGRFEAHPVTIEGGGTNTYWYAPGVGLVKWKNGNRLIVLSKYTAGKGAKK